MKLRMRFLSCLRIRLTTMANRPSGAKSIAWGLMSMAPAKARREERYFSSAACSAHSTTSSVNTASIWPHAAESISTAGLKA